MEGTSLSLMLLAEERKGGQGHYLVMSSSLAQECPCHFFPGLGHVFIIVSSPSQHEGEGEGKGERGQGKGRVLCPRSQPWRPGHVRIIVIVIALSRKGR